jgi:hypothetical protein
LIAIRAQAIDVAKLHYAAGQMEVDDEPSDETPPRAIGDSGTDYEP